MPYCLYCGVKLNDRYTFCPLCETEIEFPQGRKDLPPLYPKEINKISIINSQKKPTDWIFVHFFGFITLMQILLTSGIDFYLNNTLSWSLISTCSILYIYLSITSVINLKKHPFLIYLTLNFLLSIFLFFIDILTGDFKWYKLYALPSLIMIQLFSVSAYFIFKFVKSKLLRSVIITIFTNVLLIIVNDLISDSITWSLITTSILLPTSLFLMFLYFRFDQT